MRNPHSQSQVYSALSVFKPEGLLGDAQALINRGGLFFSGCPQPSFAVLFAYSDNDAGCIWQLKIHPAPIRSSQIRFYVPFVPFYWVLFAYLDDVIMMHILILMCYLSTAPKLLDEMLPMEHCVIFVDLHLNCLMKCFLGNIICYLSIHVGDSYM